MRRRCSTAGRAARAGLALLAAAIIVAAAAAPIAPAAAGTCRPRAGAEVRFAHGVVTPGGRLAVIQDAGGTRVLDGAGDGRSCLLDAGNPVQADGPLADLTARRERIAWFNHGVHFGEDLAARDC